MFQPFYNHLTHGITRDVFLLGNYAIKIPNMRYGYRYFLQGLLANLQERQWNRYNNPLLCPVLISDPLGLCVIMQRCEEIPEDYVIDYSLFSAVPSDDKPDNYGLLNGQVVKLDYGS